MRDVTVCIMRSCPVRAGDYFYPASVRHTEINSDSSELGRKKTRLPNEQSTETGYRRQATDHSRNSASPPAGHTPQHSPLRDAPPRIADHQIRRIAPFQKIIKEYP